MIILKNSSVYTENMMQLPGLFISAGANNRIPIPRAAATTYDEAAYGANEARLDLMSVAYQLRLYEADRNQIHIKDAYRRMLDVQEFLANQKVLSTDNDRTGIINSSLEQVLAQYLSLARCNLKK